MQTIGQISLNISATIYLIWFVPQIFLNFKRKDVKGLSILMHSILCIGYLCDLMYGFGREMQWQYKMVTIVGLLSLSVQHYQFFRYGLQQLNYRRIYTILSLVCILLLGYIIFTIPLNYHSKNFYDAAGMIANLAGITYMLPQIVKNHTNASTVGLSLSFIMLGIFLKSCDILSAYSLDWDYPSKIGPAVSLMGSLILVGQVIYFTRKYLPNRQSGAPNPAVEF